MIFHQQISPEIRLQVLTEYMDWWVDRWPNITLSFDQFFYRYRPETLPGTKEHARAVATHCYYCFTPLLNEEPFMATIDHFEPKSKMDTEKYVICCSHCNAQKGNTTPDQLIKRLNKAEFNGLLFWGFSGKKLKSVAERIRSVYNDRLWNRGPNVYYIKM